MLKSIEKLKSGHNTFHQTRYPDLCETFTRLAQGQQPDTLMISCCDSRIDPAILTHSAPGDLFIVRNVANLVPAYAPEGHTFMTSETVAALEYGVHVLNIGHIVVFGHQGCGGIHALMKNESSARAQLPAAHAWVETAARARTMTHTDLPDASLEDQCRHCEQVSIRCSLQNLRTYPWIAERVEQGHIQLHGWYITLPDAVIHCLDPQTSHFTRMI